MDDKVKYKRRMEAVRILAQDPKATVTCPECENALLQIMDVPMEDSGKVDRYMTCDNCGIIGVINNPVNRG